MIHKSSLFTARIVAALALAGVIGLTACSKTHKEGPDASTKSDGSGGTSSANQPAKSGAGAKPTIDPRLDAIMTELEKAFEANQAISANISVQLGMAAGGKGDTQGTGAYETQVKNGKRLRRLWLANSLRIFADDKSYVTDEYIDDIYDGEYLYKRLQQHKLKQITKRAYTPSAMFQIGGRDLFSQIREGYTLRLLADEPVNETPTCVIEATPIGGTSKAKHYFDRTTGVRVKLMEYNAQGENTLNITLSEVGLHPEFGENNFKPSFPPDFKLIDETAPSGPRP